jgi:hypothetical protein
MMLAQVNLTKDLLLRKAEVGGFPWVGAGHHKPGKRVLQMHEKAFGHMAANAALFREHQRILYFSRFSVAIHILLGRSIFSAILIERILWNHEQAQETARIGFHLLCWINRHLGAT